MSDDLFNPDIASGPSETVAFLADADPPSLAQTICAMANTQGGRIYVGVVQTISETASGATRKVFLPGAPRAPLERLTSSLSSFFDDPLPHVSARPLDNPAGGGPLSLIEVARNTAEEPVALDDLTIWERHGSQNISIRARTRPIRDRESGPITTTLGIDNLSSQSRLDSVTLSTGGTAQSNSAPSKKDLDHAAASGESQSVEERDRRTPEDSSDQAGSVLGVTQNAASIVDRTGASAVTSGDALDLRRNARQAVTSGDAVDHRRNARQAVICGDALDLRRNARQSEKCLHVDAYANAIAAYFSAVKNEPLCFALFGHWGRGKSFLMDETSDRLLLQGYEVVKFSAWKYRSTPELWAFLYETVLERARKASKVAWLILPFRFGLARFGVWPAICTIVALAVGVIGLRPHIAAVESLLPLLGLMGMLSLGVVVARFRTFGQRMLKQYAALASHQKSLGLQAAIGNDLKALLIAWFPQQRWIKRSDDTRAGVDWRGTVGAHWVPVAMYCMSVLCVAVALGVSIDPGTTLSPLAVPAAWIFLSAVVVVPLFIRSSTSRVLLVIDDLDRCPGDQMLEIVESIMLMLDDPEIQSRVQVCMLVQEDLLSTAIIKKYSDVIDAGNAHKGAVVSKREPKEIVRENFDKYFGAHLRLSALDGRDIEELLEKYLDYEPPRVASFETDNASAREVLPEDVRQANVIQSGTDSLVAKREVKVLRESIPFSQHEKKAIRTAAAKLTASYPVRWGPRAIRCFLWRYQLARTLLTSLGEQPIPEDLVKRLLEQGEMATASDRNGRDLMSIIVEQVS